MNSRKDRYGLAYGEILKIQEEHLALWKPLLAPEVYASTVRVCQAKNCPATDPVHGLHTCPRGAELANLILAYPQHHLFLSEAFQSALD